MFCVIRFFATVFLLVVVAGCGGKGNLPTAPPDAPANTPSPSADALGLMSPGDALELVPDRNSSYLVLSRGGHDFEHVGPQNVARENASARFSPEWVDNTSGFEQLAYAIYRFRVADYDGNHEILLIWGEEPSDYSNLFVGLSHWDSNRWDWFPALADGSIDLGNARYADYAKPTTGNMLVAVVMMGTEEALLDQLIVGYESISVVNITPHAAVGFPGENQEFRVYYTGTDDDTVTFNWNFGGGATPNTATDPNTTVILGSEGTYGGSVTVDNDHGDPDTLNFAFTVNEIQQDVSVWPMFGHDPHHTRRSTFVGAQTDSLKWEIATPNYLFGHGDPVIAPNGTVYVGSGAKLNALNPDGSIKWQSEVDCNPGFRPALADDGTIYVTGRNAFDHLNRELYAINPDGSLNWIYSTNDYFTSPPVIGSDGSVYIGVLFDKLHAVNPDGSVKFITPETVPWITISFVGVGSDETVYCAADSMLQAYDSEGNLEWEYYLATDCSAPPTIGNDGTIYLGTRYGEVIAVNSDGTLLWEFDSTEDREVTSPVIGDDGTLYVGLNQYKLFAINPDGSYKWESPLLLTESNPVIGVDGSILICNSQKELYAFNLDGSLNWIYETEQKIKNSSPVVGSDGTVFIGETQGSKFYALSSDGNYQWDYSQNIVDCSPTIALDGTIFIGNNGHLLLAVNPDGTWKWGYGIGGEIESSPAIRADGHVYANSIDAYLSVLDPDGTVVMESPGMGSHSSIMIIEDWFWSMGSSNGNIYTFNLDNTERWSYTTEGEVNSSPAIGLDGTLYVGSNDRELYAMNQDGSLKWSYATGGEVESSPAISSDGSIYVGSNDNNLYAFNPDGSLKWSFPTGGKLHSSPGIGLDGTVYVGSQDDNLYAINPDGSLQWSYATGDDVDSSPAIGGDGAIYVGSNDNNVYAINPDGSLLWSYATGNDVYSSPAIGSDGTVYVGSRDGKMYAFGDLD